VYLPGIIHVLDCTNDNLTHVYQTSTWIIPGKYTWTVPADVTSIYATVTSGQGGGGGGGTGSSALTSYPGSNGKNGTISTVIVILCPGVTVMYLDLIEISPKPPLPPS
jgi:hypothetical protein